MAMKYSLRYQSEWFSRCYTHFHDVYVAVYLKLYAMLATQYDFRLSVRYVGERKEIKVAFVRTSPRATHVWSPGSFGANMTYTHLNAFASAASRLNGVIYSLLVIGAAPMCVV
jgi:hypothetical protein